MTITTTHHAFPASLLKNMGLAHSICRRPLWILVSFAANTFRSHSAFLSPLAADPTIRKNLLADVLRLVAPGSDEYITEK